MTRSLVIISFRFVWLFVFYFRIDITSKNKSITFNKILFIIYPYCHLAHTSSSCQYKYVDMCVCLCTYISVGICRQMYLYLILQYNILQFFLEKNYPTENSLNFPSLPRSVHRYTCFPLMSVLCLSTFLDFIFLQNTNSPLFVTTLNPLIRSSPLLSLFHPYLFQVILKALFINPYLKQFVVHML